MKSIIEWIKDGKSITKRDIMDKLNWGRGIKWTPYRRALMNHPNIFDVIFPDEGVQEEFLSSYGNYEGSVDDIPTNLLASIPLVSKVP